MSNLFKWLYVSINLVLVASIIYSCAHLISINNEKVDQELAEYVDSYKGLLKEHCPDEQFTSNFTVALVDNLEGENWIGVCKSYFNNRFEVEIDREWFLYNDSANRKQLLYHELAHCFLGQQHHDSRNNYMYYQFVYIKPAIFMNQAIYDIREYCVR